MEKLVSLCKRRGFIFPGSEIYGGLANSWDYGPLGVQMKINIKNDWWKKVVEERDDMVGLDGAILMNPKVWEASGHVETFNDPLVEDKKTHKRYRADHLIQDITGMDVDGKSLDELAAIIKEKDIKSPDGNELTSPRQFSGMFETTAGAAGEGKQVIYLRPETAQAMFVNFKNVLDTSRKRIPFGIAQIGKAFRNEITPGNFIFRTLEFEQMEIEFFIEESDWEKQFELWNKWRLNWAKSIGINEKLLSFEEHAPEKLSHYSKKTTDVMFKFPFGVQELWGLAYRTDYDLSQHEKFSGQNLTYTDPNDNSRKFIPHVIEPTFGVDRTLLAILVSAYDEEEVNGETRVVMRFKNNIAPYQIAILPLSKKEQLSTLGKEVFNNLNKDYRCEYDETQSIGKRYRRQDEIGTPFCITVDFESLEDGMVTVRDRDSMEQTRIAIDKLNSFIQDKIQ
ncbi:MAG: glycine--tRNA ligase [bacterium]|nr:glycine--tRNA ligase [bacterium]